MTADPPAGTATVAIVDDHQLLVETVTMALRATGIGVVAIPPRGTGELLEALLLRAPDLVLLDLNLGPFGDSTEIIRPLVDAGIRVLLVTGVPDRLRVAAALQQGAIGFQPKSAGFDALLDATHAALAATGPLHPAQTGELLSELDAHRRRTAASLRPFAALTEREQQALRDLADGRTVNEIAGDWVVSLATIRSHVQRILHKLGVTSQLQAVALARQSGWLESREVVDDERSRQQAG